jgi:hypothetical protein
VHELLSKFVDYRGKDVGWSEFVHGLSKGDKDKGDLELMIGEVSKVSGSQG